MVIYAAFVQNLQERHQNNIIQKQPPECFIKKAVLKSFAIFPGKRLCWSLPLIKFPSFRPTSSQLFDKVAAQLYQKETPIQVFSSECCGIFKNTYFEKHLETAASDYQIGAFLAVFEDGSQMWYFLAHLESSHRRCSVKKGVLRIFAKFRGKHLCHSLFFNKVAGLLF